MAVTIASAALLLAGCGITNPYAHTTRSSDAPGSSAGTVSNPILSQERNGTIPAGAAAANTKLATGAGSRSQLAAVRTYTGLYINWTAHTVAAAQKHLAAISLDGARAEALQAAASYGADSTLQSSRVSNTGTVMSIARGEGTAVGEWVIVTREQTHGSGTYVGLPASDHVYLVALTHLSKGWVVSSWNPQS